MTAWIMGVDHETGKRAPKAVDGSPCDLVYGAFVTSGNWLLLKPGEWATTRAACELMCE